MKFIALLPWADWLALVCFVGLWAGYAWFAKTWGARKPSLLGTTNRYRGYWMTQTTARRTLKIFPTAKTLLKQFRRSDQQRKMCWSRPMRFKFGKKCLNREQRQCRKGQPKQITEAWIG